MKEQITLTIGEIRELALFAGIYLNDEKSVYHGEPDAFETEICVSQIIEEGADEIKFKHRYAWFEEYPEEGVMPLANHEDEYKIHEATK